MDEEDVVADERDVVKAGRRRTRFFLAMSALITTIVFVGFAPTYFLSSTFDAPALTLPFRIHGALFTAWLALLLAQSLLIYKDHTRQHRRLGVLGVALAVPMAITGAWVTVIFVLRRNSSGVEDPAYLYATASIFWVNVVFLSSFLTFVALGAYFRRRPDIHKRLMILATLSITSPALARVGDWGILGLSQIQFMAPVLLALLLALPLYDLVTRRRVMSVSIIGAAWLFVGSLIGGTVLPRFEAALSIIRAF